MKVKHLILLLSLFFVFRIENDSLGQGAHSTAFNPQTDGFKFGNSFTNTVNFIAGIKITTSGLCGGMSYAALDYYFQKTPIPKQSWTPADHSILYDYIYNRQTTSVVENADKWVELILNPFGARTNEFFSWGLQGTNGGRLQELKSFIDRGIPVPLGLFAEGSGGVPGVAPHHQVLAIGYDCGRYQGTLGPYQEDLKIYCYNPNYPNEITTLVPNSTQHYYYWKEHPDSHHYITYFVDKKYVQQTPPPDPTLQANLTDCKAHELVIQFGTGSDDLRGGDDNCNLRINLTNGSSQQFLNVNNGARWADNKSNTIELFLNNPVPQNQLKNIQVFTKHCEGTSCDNWNLNNLTVTVRGGFPDNSILNLSGNPLYRFTGSEFAQTYNFENIKACGGSGIRTVDGRQIINPGNILRRVPAELTNKLLVIFKTGGDDLRGGNDNLNVTLHFRDSSTQVFNNVNAGANWTNNSTNTVALNLNKNVVITDIMSMDLQTKPCGGIDCDNWNFQGISIRAEGNNLDKPIYLRNGDPLYRFTGTNNKFTFVIQNP